MSSRDADPQDPPKRIIRVHPKVRSGCKTCKRRRIKASSSCDETEPVCKNCTKRNIDCVWKEKTQPKKERPEERALVPSSSSSTLPTPLSAPRPADVATLQLMHHYTVVTSASFCANPAFTTTSTIHIPRLSFTNPFLLHAMLSCTALHLARLYPPEMGGSTWLSTAHANRSIAMDYLKASPTNSTSSDTQFIGICFLTLCTISSSLAASPANIFGLLKVVHKVWSKLTSFAYRDPNLGDMNFITRLSSFASSQTSTPLRLPYHLNRIPESTSFPEAYELADPEVVAAYKSAVDTLLSTAYPLSQTGFETMCAILWPAFFSKKFCQLLIEKRQRALVLLYHYLVMLQGVEQKGCWWACDATRCLDFVENLVDIRCRAWLASEWIEEEGGDGLLNVGVELEDTLSDDSLLARGELSATVVTRNKLY
uniref:Zn(2)-C6 fungal-type domain-containing protein n=1 Tax=Moniliophthora roreri TaxID=221103 RepID=A0A0W0FEW4_MONRR